MNAGFRKHGFGGNPGAYLRGQIRGCLSVVAMATKVRPHVERLRAKAQTVEELDAIARVSDRVAQWEGYQRNADRYRRLLTALEGHAGGEA